MIEGWDTGQELLPLVAGSIIALVVSVVVVILCVCGESKDTKEPKETYRPTAEQNQKEDVVLTIEKSVVPLLNDQQQNGALRNSSGSSGGGSSPHPPGSGHRELPQPPTGGINPNRSATIAGHHKTSNTNSNTGNRNTIAGFPTAVDDNDDYDHLVRSINTKRKSNYDHVTIGDDGMLKLEERKNNDSPLPAGASSDLPENDYAEVQKENIYEGVKDDKIADDLEGDYNKVKDEIPKHLKKPYDPYSMVADEGSDGTFRDVDPYASVKDSVKVDDPYAKVKNGGKDFDPYSKVKDDPYSKVPDDSDDPYNKVEDPYNKVKDDDPYSKVKGDDPYSKVKGDDPYNRVKDEDEAEDPYNKVKDDEESGGTLPAKDVSYQYSKVDINRKNKAGADQSNDVTVTVRNSGDFSVQSYAGEYAQVVKNRNRDVPPTPPPVNKRHSENDPYALPPEPPRRYNDPVSMTSSTELVVIGAAGATASTSPGVSASSPAGHIEQSTPPAGDPTTGTMPLTDVPTATAPGTGATGKKEPPYHKLTARESMASINARRAMNTYEEVRETENMYATVEGSSGDGVVKNGKVDSRSATPKGDYAEIGATGGRNDVVPAPPSLDSLHLMARMDGKQRLSGDLDHIVESSQKSPGARSNPRHSGGGFNDITGSVGYEVTGSIGMVNPAFDGADTDGCDITLDPNYTTVRDCIPDSEADPNYESVEEARAKSNFKSDQEKEREMIRERKIRAHVYEVVKTEAEQVKERVLRSHMYEDLDGVKYEKEKLENNHEAAATNGKDAKTEEKSQDTSKRNSEIWKRRSDVEDEKL